MRVANEPEEDARLSRLGRRHPYEGAEADSGAKYYDFRQHPELIETSLEDFLPFAHFPAIQRFYGMLGWTNGPTSRLETNDCLLSAPAANLSSELRATHQICGRLMVIFRDYVLNVHEPAISWFGRTMETRLRTKDTGFVLGAVGYSRQPTLFLKLADQNEPAEGYSVVLRFWAWGIGIEDSFRNLDRVFRNLEDGLRYVSNGVDGHARRTIAGHGSFAGDGN
jgi:hypothetical protein